MTWRAAVDYRQGSVHRKQGTPCQDFGIVRKLDHMDAVIGAIADGAGSAALSHIGAQTASHCALSLLAERAAEVSGPDETLLQNLIDDVRRRLADAADLHGCSPDDLACTLIAFVAWPTGIAAIQIGDGFLISGDGRRGFRRIGAGHHGEYINETLFVTDPDVGDQAEIVVETGTIRFIAAATDGLQHVSISSEDGRPHQPFFRPLNDYVTMTANDDEIHWGIREFLRSEKLSERVDDDVALLLCGWREEQRAGVTFS